MVFFLATVLLLFLSGAGIYFFENPAQPEVFTSVFSSLWWTVATLTTVGYGDIYPITVGGKIFTFVILMIGLGIIAVPAGILSSSLSKARDMEKSE
jgi:voltage-gated potassium channel